MFSAGECYAEHYDKHFGKSIRLLSQGNLWVSRSQECAKRQKPGTITMYLRNHAIDT
jgi:hypothetical protein